MFLSEWREFPSAPCRKRNLMTARVSMLLKSRASLICFRACFFPGRAKDLPAPRYIYIYQIPYNVTYSYYTPFIHYRPELHMRPHFIND